jgi:hypothetical protein
MAVRPWWRDGQLIDLLGALVSVGEEAGLVLYERDVALLAALRDDDLVPRSSFFALEQVRKEPQRGVARSVTRPRGLVDLPAGFFHHPRTRVNDRGSVDSKDATSEGIEAGSGIRFLPATYVEMSPEKEERAVAGVAGLLGVLVDNQCEMALTPAGSWRSGLDQPNPRPGEGGDNGIEEDHDPAGARPHHGRDDPRRALPPDLH